MKNKIILPIILITISITFLYSCRKDIAGCMDKDSTNYNESATKDDGSCKYSCNVLYWWKAPFSDSCSTYGITTIKVYLDGTFKGALAVSSQSWATVPSCGASATITASVDMGSSKTKTVVEKAEYYMGTTLFTTVTSNLTLKANACNTTEQTW